MSDGVIIFFNHISNFIGMAQVEPAGGHFFVVLATAYMYIVALLAFLMYRDPRNSAFPFLLFNAKVASSVISLFVFLFDKHLLICVTNCLVDGLIALLVFVMYRSVRKASQ
jgi:hypothetical protein